MAPLEPTRVPVIVRRSFCNMKPSAQRAQPMKLLSTLITTGNLAPQIDSVVRFQSNPDVAANPDAPLFYNILKLYKVS